MCQLVAVGGIVAGWDLGRGTVVEMGLGRGVVVAVLRGWDLECGIGIVGMDRGCRRLAVAVLGGLGKSYLEDVCTAVGDLGGRKVGGQAVVSRCKSVPALRLHLSCRCFGCRCDLDVVVVVVGYS